MKISIGGDLFLGGDLNDFSGKILNSKAFDHADFRFVNLEQAASNKPIPVDKCTLYSSEKALELLLENNINGVGLANNHIHDLGADGIICTRDIVERLGVKVTGAGATIEQAAEAVTIDGEVSIFLNLLLALEIVVLQFSLLIFNISAISSLSYPSTRLKFNILRYHIRLTPCLIVQYSCLYCLD